MKIDLLQIGKTDNPAIIELVKIYNNRLIHYTDFNIITIPDIKDRKNLNIETLKLKEAELIIKHLDNNSCKILLDERGNIFSSIEFAAFINNKTNQSTKKLAFIIAGAYGASERLISAVDSKLSLSKMTFSHQIIRAIFLEQLYRAFTIIKNEPYHNS